MSRKWIWPLHHVRTDLIKHPVSSLPSFVSFSMNGRPQCQWGLKKVMAALPDARSDWLHWNYASLEGQKAALYLSRLSLLFLHWENLLFCFNDARGATELFERVSDVLVWCISCLDCQDFNVTFPSYFLRNYLRRVSDGSLLDVWIVKISM